MPLDPSIIMGFKPTVELADPNKVQSEQLANQFNQAKLQEVQQGIQTKNAMRQLDPNAPDYASQVMRLDPETGIKYGAYASKLASEQVKTQLDKMQASRENNANLAFNPSDANVTAHIEDSLLRKDITYDQAMGSLEKVLGNPSKGISPMPMQARKDYFLHLGLTADQAVKEMSSNLDRDVQMRGQDITKRGQDITAGITGRGQNIVRDTATAGREATARNEELNRNQPKWSESLQSYVSPSGAVVPANIPVGTPTKTEREATQALKQGARQALLTAGYDPKTGKDKVTPIIEQTAGGFFPSATRATLGAFNVTTSGGEALAKAKVISGRITLDMLQGKLGQGISEGDRQMIQQLSGAIGDGMLPANERLAAWKQFKDIMVNYSGFGTTAPSAPSTTAKAPVVGEAQGGYVFKGGNPSDKNNWRKQ